VCAGWEYPQTRDHRKATPHRARKRGGSAALVGLLLPRRSVVFTAGHRATAHARALESANIGRKAAPDVHEIVGQSPGLAGAASGGTDERAAADNWVPNPSPQPKAVMYTLSVKLVQKPGSVKGCSVAIAICHLFSDVCPVL
jgi:hypothetical protein